MPSVTDDRQDRLNIVIIGGGIIGCTAAYYLTDHPEYSPERHSVTLLEATRIAGGASGKAGGLLAQWAYPASLVPLSFDLHQQLAEEHDGARAWGYRTIGCGKLTARDRRLQEAQRKAADAARGIAAAGRSTAPQSWAAQLASWVPLGKWRELNKEAKSTKVVEMPEDLDWFRRDTVRQYENVAPQRETAQVQPYLFTCAMAKLAEERGARVIVNAAASEIEYGPAHGEVKEPAPTADDDSEQDIDPGARRILPPSPPPTRAVRAVHYVDKTTGLSERLPVDVVILAAGPWTPELFPSVPMNALRAHSITIRPTRALSPYCLFTDISVPQATPASTPAADSRAGDPYFESPRSGRDLGEEAMNPTEQVVSPEIYSRPNNEVYVAGESDTRVPLPASTDEVEVDREACRLIEGAVAGVSDELRDGVVTSRRACYLPTVALPSGNPLVGPTWVDGLLLATGHSCWGIHNAPATGKLISEMVYDGEAKSADISALDPRIVI